jgi:hypothetical protein
MRIEDQPRIACSDNIVTINSIAFPHGYSEECYSDKPRDDLPHATRRYVQSPRFGGSTSDARKIRTAKKQQTPPFQPHPLQVASDILALMFAQNGFGGKV